MNRTLSNNLAFVAALFLIGLKFVWDCLVAIVELFFKLCQIAIFAAAVTFGGMFGFFIFRLYIEWLKL